MTLASTILSSDLAQQCVAAGIPVLLLNRKIDGAPVSSITGDNLVGGGAIAAHLLAQGHRRFAFVAGLEASSTSRDREAGFAQALVSHGLGYARAVGHYSFDGAKQAARELLSAAEPPDAIFFANDHMAIAGIEAARHEFGRKVGQDLSIAGFDDVACAAWAAYDLTTYSQRIDRMVALVTDTVTTMIADRGAERIEAIVEGSLVVRSSTRRNAV